MAENPVARKIALLERILQLTQVMQEEVADGVSEALLTLLDERGKLIHEAEQCDWEIDFTTLAPEERERMLVLLRQIAVLNEDISARLTAAIAAEENAILSLRRERNFLQRVQENLPSPHRFEAGG